MKWSDAFIIGVDRIDHQHRMLFQMVNDFESNLEEGRGARVYGDFLHSLDVYARSHFSFEESCMERYRCPAAAENRSAHGNFIEFVSGFRVRFEEQGFVPHDASNLIETLDEWLSEHIGRLDVRLRDSVQGTG